MSSITSTPTTTDAHADDPHGHGNGHDPHLAHHFDTPEQQFASGKLGMWVFLATEILMFGGLFCAYSVYRHNHPEVFEVAHKQLDKTLGAINTVVLITSSLTMAWGVRLAQLGRNRGLIITLILTILGGYGFMAIKSIEYKTKWSHDLGVGTANQFRPARTNSQDFIPGAGTPAAGGHGSHGDAAATAENPGAHAKNPEAHDVKTDKHDATTGGNTGEDKHRAPAAPAVTAAPAINPDYHDPNANTPDAAQVKPVAVGPRGLKPEVAVEHDDHSPEALAAGYATLPTGIDKERTYTFFQVYFLMTGLHGIHVVVGMALIFWILLRSVPGVWKPTVKWFGLASLGLFFLYVGILVSNNPTWIIGLVVLIGAAFGWVMGNVKPKAALAGVPGEFGPDYFTPVDIVGLYWHLVDLIWIFLFPLLYLIH